MWKCGNVEMLGMWRVKIKDLNMMCWKEPLSNYYYAAAIIAGGYL